MKIRVRTVGWLARHLPEHRADNLVDLEVPEGSAARDVVERLDFPDDRSYLVTLNGQVVPADRLGRTSLSEGDELTILPKPKVG